MNKPIWGNGVVSLTRGGREGHLKWRKILFFSKDCCDVHVKESDGRRGSEEGMTGGQEKNRGRKMRRTIDKADVSRRPEKMMLRGQE